MPTITFSGLASGMDTSSWVDALVSVKQMTVTSLQSTLSTLETKQSQVSALQTSFNSLRTSVEKITDARFGDSMSLFAANTATSSNDKAFTATATKSASRQSYDIEIEQLATKTVATSESPVGAVVNDDTKLSTLNIKEGKFTVYVNNEAHQINIVDDEDIATLKDDLEAVGVSADIDSNGILTLSAQNDEDTLLIGAANDTSNFKSVLGLTKQDSGSYEASTAMYQVTASSKITESGIFAGGDVTQGSFKIGDATFEIGANTTINDIITAINSSETAGVTAYWDSTASKMKLTSKIDGQNYINIEAGTSNFTDIMELTDSTWNDGSLVSTRLKTDTQTLGDNAVLYINGTRVVSDSNVVTSDVSRLDGVTLTLKATTEEDTTETLSVEQDISGLVSVLSDFVDKYNSVIDTLDELTSTDGNLYGDTALNNIKRSLRQLVTSAVNNDGSYSLLSQIGISTADVGADLSDDTSKLSLDESKLTQALSENPDAVKSLLMEAASTENGKNTKGGVFTQIDSLISTSLSSSGYFSTTLSTIASNISKYNDKISTQTTRIASYKSSLESKFQAMEETISSLQSGYSDLLSSSS